MKQWFLWICLLALLGLPMVSNAQTESTTPIYFLMDGDIWSYDVNSGQLIQESNWGFNRKPVLSPDGTRFAYVSEATVAVNYYNSTGGYLTDPVPTNIWVWDVATNDAYRLVDQPQGAAITQDETGFPVVQNVVRRESLAWSPDGTQLAWLELDTNFQIDLLIHDFTDDTRRIVPADLPYPYGDAGYIGVQGMAWGTDGILIENFGFSTGTFTQTLTLFDPNTGENLGEHFVGGETFSMIDFGFTNVGGVAILYDNGGYAALDLRSATTVAIAPLQLINPLNAPSQTMTPQYAGYANNVASWEVLNANQQPLATLKSLDISSHIALSPNGDAVATISDSGLGILNSDGTFTIVPNTQGVASSQSAVIWGADVWHPSGVPTVAADPNCVGAPAPRLSVGQTAFVIPGLGNNVLRDAPGRNAEGSNIIGNIPPNGEFSILAGPVCASGLNWWQVDYNGQQGWTAEGDGQLYWVEGR